MDFIPMSLESVPESSGQPGATVQNQFVFCQPARGFGFFQNKVTRRTSHQKQSIER